jgi:hypothetical protein
MRHAIYFVSAILLAVPALAKDTVYTPQSPSATLTIGPGGYVRGPIIVTLGDGTVIFHVDAGSTVGTSQPVVTAPLNPRNSNSPSEFDSGNTH